MKTAITTSNTISGQTIEYLGREWNIVLDRYRDGNTLAVLLVSKHKYGPNAEQDNEDFSIVLTVNIDAGAFITGTNCSYVDTNNLGNEILELIERYNLGFNVDCSAQSGMWVYPQYAFNLEECAKYFPDPTNEEELRNAFAGEG